MKVIKDHERKLGSARIATHQTTVGEGTRATPGLDYIMAVGGAGSLGSPDAEIGRKIISAARAVSTIIPPTR